MNQIGNGKPKDQGNDPQSESSSDSESESSSDEEESEGSDIDQYNMSVRLNLNRISLEERYR